MLCLSLFPFSQDTSPPVVFMNILNYSTSKLVTSVDFDNAPSSSTLIHLHGCCSFFNVVRMKLMMHTWACLDAVGNTHSIIFFLHTIVSMEVNRQMEITWYKAKSM